MATTEYMHTSTTSTAGINIGTQELKREPQVPDQMIYLSKCVGELRELTNRIRERLDPICRLSIKPDDARGGTPEEALCNLASSIRNNRYEIAAANGELLDILERLQI